MDGKVCQGSDPEHETRTPQNTFFLKSRNRILLFFCFFHSIIQKDKKNGRLHTLMMDQEVFHRGRQFVMAKFGMEYRSPSSSLSKLANQKRNLSRNAMNLNLAWTILLGINRLNFFSKNVFSFDLLRNRVDLCCT